MKYKIGDKVTLTSGNIMTIDQIDDISKWYRTKENPWNCYTDEMIKGLAEEEKVSNANSITRDRVDKLACKNDEELPSGNPYKWECPDGYIFKDQNGNIINATKIVLEKKRLVALIMQTSTLRVDMQVMFTNLAKSTKMPFPKASRRLLKF